MTAEFHTHPYTKNQKGFTLVEILLVLFIFLLISSIVFQITVKISEKRVVDHFFQQLILDIQEMQALAIQREEKIHIQFYNSNHYKAFGVYSGETLLEKDFPSNIQLEIYSNLKRFIIDPKGEISPFGTIKFYTPYGETNLVIYIKEGRMRLVEQ
ncbi:competence type IV pilus minor pilin ComGD [Ureibacillus aquaedulcis]|uniref:Competence type IV pilus minor pilin ComGD n=1 Tax=Ureibacillus aquaedulcis TaxID=3058421 RepID=A0ABT8GPI4_9BACL|nr:competence type IV pilus minor pilin ComGD [Ureibacillus sp. BA0131]MDN4493315.1 competence type IV pilus minor pilin ComGD [Ureibacillus sp. BA0131]